MENKELIQAIYQRYKRWIWAEKETAKRILIKKLEKQWITLEEYEERFWDEWKELYTIKFPSKLWEEFFVTLYCYACFVSWIDRETMRRWSFERNFKSADIECSYAQYVNIQDIVMTLWNAYKKAKAENERLFLNAFYQKNEMFFDYREDKTKEREPKFLTADEYEKLEAMTKTIDKTEINKKLEHKQD